MMSKMSKNEAFEIYDTKLRALNELRRRKEKLDREFEAASDEVDRALADMDLAIASDIITIEQAEGLVGRLKRVSKEDLEQFLKKFNIGKIRLLPASSYEQAVGIVEALEAERKP